MIQCKDCKECLNSEEETLNLKFIEKAKEREVDWSMFPLCIKCHFK